jgi:hypothetical protein
VDLRLYEIDNSTRVSLESDAMQVVPAGDAKAEGLEVLANKVVKFLLTIAGSDLSDPEYGCALPGYTSISSQELPTVQLQLIEDIERCARFIKTTEYAGGDEDIRLSSLELIKLVYDKDFARDTLHVYIRITARSLKQAVLQIPVTPK